MKLTEAAKEAISAILIDNYEMNLIRTFKSGTLIKPRIR